MNEQSKHAHPPSVRIWLCGPFQVEWRDPDTEATHLMVAQDLHGSDVGRAFSLLKLLLCQPGRQASRDWILEQFWPEQSRDGAIHRLETIASALRTLLLPASGDESLLSSIRSKQNGLVYTLSAYPQFWVDSDAIIWNAEQAARMERFGHDSLPFWQRAFDLLKRGPFLADEPYAEWVKEHREKLEGYRRDCVYALSKLYLARYAEAGKAEAILLLRTYWQAHKTDEDALRPLIELLGEQERYQEAEEYYQQCVLVLQEEGHTPDHRTKDLHDFLHVKSLRRSKDETAQTLANSLFASKHNVEGNGQVPLSQFTTAISQEVLLAARTLGKEEISRTEQPHQNLTKLLDLPSLFVTSPMLSLLAHSERITRISEFDSEMYSTYEEDLKLS